MKPRLLLKPLFSLAFGQSFHSCSAEEGEQPDSGCTVLSLCHVEADNSVLRAQMMELSQRLQSLNEIINSMNTNNNINGGGFENEEFQTGFHSLSIY
ncbi:hypothetical protein Leryth_003630 [Lithospermum erythrorhizon]|nr:hypothetical protein Leryth_003630 [Lithospermum erythrorhizon]